MAPSCANFRLYWGKLTEETPKRKRRPVEDSSKTLNVKGYGGWDIFVCQHASVDDPWGPPQNLGPEINTPYYEGAPAISRDGHLMYFASTRPGGFGGTDIYVSRRHNKRDDFGWKAPQNLGDGVNTEYNDSNPEIFEDDENTGAIILYFDSNRPSGPGPYDNIDNFNGNDIYASVLQPDESFGPAELLMELCTTYRERQPSIRRDGLELFFVSNRPGGVGQLDLWVSTRPTTSDSWSAPVNLGAPINSPDRDGGPALSWDGTSLFFCSFIEIVDTRSLPPGSAHIDLNNLSTETCGYPPCLEE